MRYSCVILAAGSGSRTGLDYNKVFYKLNDKTVIENSIDQFDLDPDCSQVILVINPKEKDLFKKLKLGPKVEYAFGGIRRQDSVNNGLSKVTEDYVMIHDGARPYISKDVINRVKEALKVYDATVVMVKSIDTVKIVEDGIIKSTPNRDSLYNAQTPQAFKTSLIKKAYARLDEKGLSVTDDSQAVEVTSNSKIHVVTGDYKNTKITTEKDLQ